MSDLPPTCGLKGELQPEAALLRLMDRRRTGEAEGHWAPWKTAVKDQPGCPAHNWHPLESTLSTPKSKHRQEYIHERLYLSDVRLLLLTTNSLKFLSHSCYQICHITNVLSMCLTFSLIDNTFMSKWEIQFILTNGPQVRGTLPPILLGNGVWAVALATSLKRASLLTSAKVMLIKVRQLPGLLLTITFIAFLNTCLVQKMIQMCPPQFTKT